MYSNYNYSNTYYLKHYGVPGMRWRVHRGRKRGIGSYDPNRYDDYSKNQHDESAYQRSSDRYKRGYVHEERRSAHSLNREGVHGRSDLHGIPAHSDRVSGRKMVSDRSHTSRGRQGLGSYRSQVTRTYGGLGKSGSGYGSDLRENDHYTSTRANRRRRRGARR